MQLKINARLYKKGDVGLSIFGVFDLELFSFIRETLMCSSSGELFVSYFASKTNFLAHFFKTKSPRWYWPDINSYPSQYFIV